MFSLFETSRQDGAPIELYEFSRRGCEYWRYTTTKNDVLHNSHTWASESISRSRLAQANDQSRNALALIVPRNNAVADLFRISPPTDIITLTLYGLHRGDLTDPVHLWSGRVLNAKWKETSTAELQCEPVSFSMRRPGLRRLYQRNCPHVLYGNQCKVNKLNFQHMTTVTSISGSVLGVASEDSTTYPGGFVEWPFGDSFPTEGQEPCTVDRRFVTGHAANSFTLDRPFQGIQVGDEVALYPGCAHNMNVCSSIFANLDNYGGMPFMPIKNPFSGDPIY